MRRTRRRWAGRFRRTASTTRNHDGIVLPLLRAGENFLSGAVLRGGDGGKILKKWWIRVAVAAFWLGIWQLAYRLVAQEILLVSPVRTVLRLFELAGEGVFWRDISLSCLRVVAGFALALVFGALLAVLTARFAVFYHVFSPALSVVRATPVASFIVLAYLWIVTDRIPVFISFLMVMPMVWANIHAGIRETDRELLEMAKIFHFSPLKTLRYIYLPALIPYLTSATSTGLGFAWKSAIAAEVIVLPAVSIGRQIHNSKIYFETADLFAWTAAVILLSVLLEKLVIAGLLRLERRLLSAPGKGREQ